MEPAGLAIGIAGLAGIFSTCLDVLERIDSYRDFGVESRAILAQFDADKLLFQKWGQAVGLQENGVVTNRHHQDLDDPTILATVQDILISINEIAGIPSNINQGPGPTKANGQIRTSRHQPFEKFRVDGSRRNKVEWTLRQKARFLALSQQFGALVERLRALVPPESGNIMVQTIRPTRTGLGPSMDGASDPSDRQIGHSSKLDSQLILIKIQRQIEQEVRKELETWLRASHTDTIYEDSIMKKLTGTCDWILDRDTFRSWKSLDCPPKTARLLWINGPTGYGKTVVTASIIQHLKDEGISPVAFFFFSADLEDRADPFIVARSWVSQLISQSRDAFELGDAKRETQPERTASKREVLELLREILLRVPHCILIVDGLDECTSKGGQLASQGRSLSSFIREITQTAAATASRILLISREDQDIRGELSSLTSKSDGLRYMEYKISPRDVQPDATLLSRSIVNQKLSKKSQTVRDEIVHRMVDRSDSMLLRIKLTENDLRDGKNQKQLQLIVDQAPSELAGLYGRSWERIMGLHEADRSRALSILRWATFAHRSITISEITEALLV